MSATSTRNSVIEASRAAAVARSSEVHTPFPSSLSFSSFPSSLSFSSFCLLCLLRNLSSVIEFRIDEKQDCICMFVFRVMCPVFCIQTLSQIYLLRKLNSANWLGNDKDKGFRRITSSSGNFPPKLH